MAEETNTATVTGEGNGGAVETKPWLSSIPENLRGHEAFTDVKELPEVYQQFADLKVKSRSMVQIPTEKSTAEERASFYKALGVPEKPEDYKLARPADLPKDFPFDEKAVDAFKAEFHKHGISASAAQGLVDSYYKDLATRSAAMQSEIDKQIQADLDKATEALKKDWGENFKANDEIAQRAVEKLNEIANVGALTGGLSLVEYFKREGMANDPVLMKVLHAVGTKIMDDSTTFRSGAGAGELGDEAKALQMFPSMKKK